MSVLDQSDVGSFDGQLHATSGFHVLNRPPVVGDLIAAIRSENCDRQADGDKKGGLAMQCDKNDYRGVLAGLEGVTGKKSVNSDTMTVKN